MLAVSMRCQCLYHLKNPWDSADRVPFYYITTIRVNMRVESLLQGLLQGKVKESLEVVKEKVDVQEDRCPTKQLSQNKDHNTQ